MLSSDDKRAVALSFVEDVTVASALSGANGFDPGRSSPNFRAEAIERLAEPGIRSWDETGTPLEVGPLRSAYVPCCCGPRLAQLPSHQPPVTGASRARPNLTTVRGFSDTPLVAS